MFIEQVVEKKPEKIKGNQDLVSSKQTGRVF
jgi:hypothetical protein